MRTLLWLLLAAGDPRAQLEALKARKAAEEAAARLLADRERSILDTLGEAEEGLQAAESEWGRVEAERLRSERRAVEAKAEEAEAQARLEARLSELKPRLAARQRLGRMGELRLLTTAGSLSELVKRRALLDRVLRAEQFWIPNWHKASHWIAHWDKFGRPAMKPKYDRGILDTWWYDEAKAKQITAGN